MHLEKTLSSLQLNGFFRANRALAKKWGSVIIAQS